MTLTQLEYAIAVYKYRNFSKAAKICHISQPTLSMQLKKLEEYLGIILFDRSMNPIIPTEAGILFIEGAKEIITRAKNLENIAKTDSILKGPFKVAIIPTLSAGIIPLFLKDFLQHYPEVELNLIELKTPDIIEKLLTDELDVALMATPLKNERLIERPLFNEPLYAYFALKQGHHEISLKDFYDKKIFLLEEGHCLRNQALEICTHESKQNQKIKCQSIDALVAIVDELQSQTIIPGLLKNKFSKDHLIPLVRPIPVREISLVHSRLFLKEKYIDALKDIILNNLPSEISSHRKKIKILPP